MGSNLRESSARYTLIIPATAVSRMAATMSLGTSISNVEKSTGMEDGDSLGARVSPLKVGVREGMPLGLPEGMPLGLPEGYAETEGAAVGAASADASVATKAKTMLEMRILVFSNVYYCLYK